MHKLLSLSLLSFALSGCGLFGVNVKTVKTVKMVSEPPSDITAFVKVKDGDQPVAQLTEADFKIYENDVLLDNDKIGLRLLSRDAVAAGFTVLLLDLSGSPDETEVTRIERGAAHFVEKVTTTQPVTVVAFDGSDRAREVARFSKVTEPTKRPLPPLEKFLSDDSSRDLNSALLSSIQGVSAYLKEQTQEGRFGTVVTLLRGPDLAGRKSDADVRDAISDSSFDFYSISPKGAHIKTLGVIGRTSKFEFDTMDTLPMRFTDLGMRVRDSWNSNYLVSYCSPGRSGERKMKIRVVFENEKGAKKSGSTKSKFDASNFKGGCVPKQGNGQEDPNAEPIGEEAGSKEADNMEIQPQKMETVGDGQANDEVSDAEIKAVQEDVERGGAN